MTTLGPVLVFLAVWLVIAFRRLRWLPIGRPAGALAGAVAMVAVGALTAEEAWAAIDGGTIGLLLGMMLLTAYGQRAGWFDWASHRLVSAAGTPLRLLLAVSWSAAALSALLVNDTVCLFLTPLVIDVVRRARLPLGPYLVALATSANVGSAATLVGNPQNMLIGSMSGLPFLAFLAAVGPAALVGMGVHTAVLLVAYRRLATLPATFAAGEAPALGPDAPMVAVVGVGVLSALLLGLNLGMSALGGAVALMLLDRRDAGDVLAAVDWTLLLFFAGLFVVVRGFASTGLPEDAWLAVAPWISLEGSGLAVVSGALMVGSNLVSNVPLVLLVGDQLADLGRPELAWALLGFVTTIAGNLTLVGSVANVIVAEQARAHHELGFFEYLAVGLPSTLLVTAAGVVVLTWTA